MARMSYMKWFFITLLVLISLSACSSAKRPPPSAVARLDVARFSGMWYEAARLPFAWQRDCAAAAARYEKVDDETFSVVNYCWYKTADGPMRKKRTRAFVDNFDRRAQLKVQLVWPRWENYSIIYIDKAYRHVIIGSQNRRQLWIMSRDMRMDDARLTKLISIAKQQGYDTERLIMADTTTPPTFSEPADETTSADAGTETMDQPVPSTDNRNE